MKLQNQKAKIEEMTEALDLGPLARLLDRVTGRRVPAAKAIKALAAALGEIAERHAHEPDRVSYGLELRRRAKLDRSRVRQLRDGDDAPALTSADLKVLKAADAVEAMAVKGQRGAPSIRAEAARRRDAVGDALTARAEARRADLRLAQTIELEAEREGVAVTSVLEAKRGTKQRRLRTRDGLALAHERDTFRPRDAEGQPRRDMAARIEADRLLSVGLRYRDRYEVAQASLKSCLAQADGVKTAPTLYVQAIAARRRAALANQVRVLDVAVVTKLGPDALLVLRMVAGEARTVRSLSTSSRRREALAKLLPLALAVIGEIIVGAS